MGNMLSILLKSPVEILMDMGGRAKEARLALGWTRKTLSVRSGVPEPTIKRFETTGLIGTQALVNMALALDMSAGLDTLFQAKPIQSVSQARAKKRVRGVL
jgi:transcriptional regulator with XRE-family HTH domain